MRALTVILVAMAGAVSTAHAETITARSPCLPATLPQTDQTDTHATLERRDRPPVQLGIYKDFDLRGSIYGEAPVASFVIDPPPRHPKARLADDDSTQQAPACP